MNINYEFFIRNVNIFIHIFKKKLNLSYLENFFILIKKDVLFDQYLSNHDLIDH
jgi:hypothetical protein